MIYLSSSSNRVFNRIIYIGLCFFLISESETRKQNTCIRRISIYVITINCKKYIYRKIMILEIVLISVQKRTIWIARQGNRFEKRVPLMICNGFIWPYITTVDSLFLKRFNPRNKKKHIFVLLAPVWRKTILMF